LDKDCFWAIIDQEMVEMICDLADGLMYFRNMFTKILPNLAIRSRNTSTLVVVLIVVGETANPVTESNLERSRDALMLHYGMRLATR